MRKTKRSRAHTIASAIASARTTPSASNSETSYSSPRQVRSTTPGLLASQVRPKAASASAARKISRRTIMTPLQNAKRAPEAARRPAAAGSRTGAACEPPDRRLADRLQRRVRRLPRPGLGRPIASRLTRGFGELVEGSERAANIAALAFRLDLGDQSLRIVAGGLAQIAHPHEIVDMGKE